MKRSVTVLVVMACAYAPAILVKSSAAAASFVVSSTRDGGEGSLRWAIERANETPELDTIAFALPAGEPFTIRPTSPLPALTAPVVLDGTTQPGFAGTPVVELDGSSAGEGDGLVIVADGVTIRGLVVNGFPGHGIELIGSGSLVEGNYVGTDVAGAREKGNEGAGILANNSRDNVIGGLAVASRNLISGNKGEGIFLEGPGSTGNVIAGNLIGTDTAGTAPLGNGLVGVLVSDAPGNTVGGSQPGAGNVVSANGYEGIAVEGDLATGNRVEGNLVGVGVDGVTPLGNTFAGVVLDENASDNTVGGVAAGSGNVVAFNRADGIEVASGRRNGLLGNAIFSNRGIGITLGGREVSRNDPDDADTGPNDLQNYPVLRTAASEGSATNVSGRLDSAAVTSYRVEFFASAECDVYGFGEGASFVGSADVTTDGDGVALFDVSLPVAVDPGFSLTATATDPDGNTSEFSWCVQVALAWEPPDPQSGEPNPPPRSLSAVAVTERPVAAETDAAAAQSGTLLGYKVYGTTAPGQPPSPSTLLVSIPPSQTSATVPTAPTGSFFVVTAVYDSGESGPSNEVAAGAPPTVDSIKVKRGKLVADGSAFTDVVNVLVDGIPFAAPGKVKKGRTRVVQRGQLVTGQTLAAYTRSVPRRPDGRARILIGFRNATGGVTSVEYDVAP